MNFLRKIQGIIIYNDFLATILSMGKVGITLFPFIFIREELKTNAGIDILINHERIHIAQQVELGIVGLILAILALVLTGFHWIILLFIPGVFLFLYGLSYILQTIMGKDDPYRHVIFEREAYANHTNFTYLETRRMFDFLWNSPEPPTE